MGEEGGESFDHLVGTGEQCRWYFQVERLRSLIVDHELEPEQIQHLCKRLPDYRDNLPRILPKNCDAMIDTRSWRVPEIFNFIGRMGKVDRIEMYQVFNMGIGLILIVPPQSVDPVLAKAVALGDRAWLIGEIVSSTGKEPEVEYAD